METLRENRKTALVSDIDALIAEQEAVAKAALEETLNLFMNAEAYGKALTDATCANFSIGFLRSMKSTMADMDFRQSVLLIRYHAHSLAISGMTDEYMAYAYYSLSGALEKLADAAEDRPADDHGPAVPTGRFGVYWMEDMEQEAMIAAFDSLHDARVLACGESGCNGTTMSVFDRSTGEKLAMFDDGGELDLECSYLQLPETA